MIETRKLSYYKKFTRLFVVLVAVFLIGCSGDDGKDGIDGIDGINGQTGPAAVLIVPDEIEDIQQAIDSISTNGGGTVYIKAGVYELSQGIHIKKSNITISGEQGVLIKLKDNVNQPVILIGSDAETPSDTINNIKIESLEIDGNMAAQTSETDPNRTWIRNNGIDVRMVRNLYVSEVDIHHVRSGGLVVSWNSSLIFIDDSYFHHNYDYGIGLYASEDIQVLNFFCNDNNKDGLNLGNKLSDVLFSNGFIKKNGKAGIYAMYVEDLTFTSLIVTENREHGCFLSSHNNINGSGVKNLHFSSCSFGKNNMYGIRIASSPLSPCLNNSVTGCFFYGNRYGPFSVAPEVELMINGNVYQ